MTTINGVTVGKRISINFMTNMQKLHRGIWPWTVGLKSRLPMHYKRRYIERFARDPRPVHYRFDDRKYVADRWGQPVRVQNVPIPILFPKESDSGLWGGEGLIAGFKKKNNNNLKPRNAAIWLPRLSSRVLYSEILNRWFAVTVSRLALDLIDDALGFDNYILETSEINLQSKFGMQLKREMLLALANKSAYVDDPAKQEAILKKYTKHVIPAEEAEWVGLTLYEAERKQHEMEEAERLQNLRPLKELYAEELARKIKDKTLEDGPEKPSLLKRLSPFVDKKDDASV